MTEKQIKGIKDIEPLVSYIKKEIVKAVIYEHNTIEKLSIHLNKKYSTIVGRVSQLLDLGILKEVGIEDTLTVFDVEFDPVKQKELSGKRTFERDSKTISKFEELLNSKGVEYITKIKSYKNDN